MVLNLHFVLSVLGSRIFQITAIVIDTVVNYLLACQLQGVYQCF